MDGNIIFQILTGFILALFAGVFFIVYLYDRRLTSSGWFALAYALGLVTFFADIAANDRMYLSTTLLTNLLFWSSSGAIAAGGLARASKPFPLRSFAAFVAFGCAGSLYFTLIDFDMAMRSSISNVVGGGIIATCLYALYGQRRRRAIDRAVCYCMAAGAATYILRPLLTFGVLGLDYQAGGYAGSTYAMVLYMTTAMSALATAAVVLIASGLDIAERLQRESDTDHLTGLYNQRGIANLLEERGEKQFSTGSVGQAVMMFDIDHFKRINDEFGHDEGDKVLRKIGRTVRQLMKYHGVAGRSGGEEFVFLFTRESSPAAFLVCEHLRVAIGMLRHEGLPADLRITISLGLVFIREGESTKRAMRRADIALYQAKDDGRNKLRLGDGDSLPEAGESRLLPNPI